MFILYNVSLYIVNCLQKITGERAILQEWSANSEKTVHSLKYAERPSLNWHWRAATRYIWYLDINILPRKCIIIFTCHAMFFAMHIPFVLI